MAYDKTQQKRIILGLCKDCGEKRGLSGTKVHCRACANKAVERATKRKTKLRKLYKPLDVCNQCGGPINDKQHNKLCEKCRGLARKKAAEYSAKRRATHPRLGLCVKCSREIIGESRYCKYHWLEMLRKCGIKKREDRDKIFNKLEEQEYRCFFTDIELIPGKNATVDHLNPKSKHPELESDIDNIVWCDKRINLMKGDFTYDEFISTCKTVLAFGEDVRLGSCIETSRPR